jgi:class 3 adenylate cyclase
VLFTLEEEGRGTRLRHRLEVTPRSAVHGWFLPLIMKRTRKGFLRGFARLEQELVSGETAGRTARRSVLRRALDRFERLGAGGGPEMPKDLGALLATHVASADAPDLRRIRPFALADRWRLPRRDVLAAHLLAVRAGVLELSWESLCPHCRGGKRPVSTLSDVTSKARCEACEVDFDLQFDRNLEAVFRPAPDLRRIGGEVWCLAGPGRTPHVAAQLRVRAGEGAAVDVGLGAGAYRMRLARRPLALTVRVEDDGAPGALDVEVEDDGLRSCAGALRAGTVHVAATNRGARDAVAVLERTAWLDDAATAMDVVCVPGFRDLFASEVLGRHERIAVGRVAILFTDLRGSTALYRRIGDAAAYAVVRDHFRVLQRAVADHGGSVVKTIGDAVMAAFRSTGDAVRAALAMHAGVGALAMPDEAVGRLVLKAGLHCGPSIVVNSNDRIDYFGTTTNLAARAQHESEGGDLVVTDEVLADDDARRALDAVPHRRVEFRAPLKGFEADVPLHRVVPVREGGGGQAGEGPP